MPLPFQGEVMVCVCCGRFEVSDPAKESNWRCIEVKGEKFYACPAHFPPDNCSALEFEAAYGFVLGRIIHVLSVRRHVRS